MLSRAMESCLESTVELSYEKLKIKHQISYLSQVSRLMLFTANNEKKIMRKLSFSKVRAKSKAK